MNRSEARQVESKLPAFLVKHQFAGMPLWQWLALILALPIAAGLGWIVLVLLKFPVQWWARRRGQMDIANWRSVSGPAWLLTGTLDPPGHWCLIAYAVVATALLLSGHFGRADSQHDLAGVAATRWSLLPRAHARTVCTDLLAPDRSCCWASASLNSSFSSWAYLQYSAIWDST